jgi:hypothetical protein
MFGNSNEITILTYSVSLTVFIITVTEVHLIIVAERIMYYICNGTIK